MQKVMHKHDEYGQYRNKNAQKIITENLFCLCLVSVSGISTILLTWIFWIFWIIPEMQHSIFLWVSTCACVCILWKPSFIQLHYNRLQFWVQLIILC